MLFIKKDRNLFAPVCLMIALLGSAAPAFGQIVPLGYPNLIIALNAKPPSGWTKDMQIKKIIADVKYRKVDKPLTPDREGDLRQAGATDELILAIKENSPQLKPVEDVPDMSGRDREAWDLVKSSNNADDFRYFLQEFPTGENANRAKVRIEEIMWAKAKASNDRSVVQAYLTEHPTGPNAAAARIKLRQLEASGAPAVTPSNEPVQKTTSANPAPPTIAPGTIRRNANGLEMVFVPAGEFMMGSSEAEIDEALAECTKASGSCERGWFTAEAPKRKVVLKNGFWIGRYEVTQRLWKSIMGNNPSKFKDCGENCPVEQVSFDDALEFIKRLNAANDGFEYSLPTEAQWEYAARAGTATPFAFGTAISSVQANFNGNYPYASTKNKYLQKTAAVGSYQPNAWGVYDMHGNVWEWTLDSYSNYADAPVDGSANIVAGAGNLRVLRGGSWFYFGGNTRSAGRSAQANNVRDDGVGFRVVARQK